MAALLVAATGAALRSRPAPVLIASTRSNQSTASTPPPACSKLSTCTGAAAVVGPVPKKMQRAKAWSFDVENTFRLQEAGYRDIHELRALVQRVGSGLLAVPCLAATSRLCSSPKVRPPPDGPVGLGVALRTREQSLGSSA